MRPGLAPLDGIDRTEMHLVVPTDSSRTLTRSQPGLDLKHLSQLQHHVLLAARRMSLTLRLPLLDWCRRFDGGCGAVKIYGLGRLQNALDSLDAVRQSADLCIRENGEHRGG